MLCYISNIRASELSSILVCCQSVNYVSSFDHFYKYLNVFMILHSHFKWWWSDERLYGPGLAFKCLVNGCFIKIEGKVLSMESSRGREQYSYCVITRKNQSYISWWNACAYGMAVWAALLFPRNELDRVAGWLARWLLLPIFHSTSCITLYPH